jgi:hypothetical protein
LGGGEYSGTNHLIFSDFKIAYDSFKREIVCNILIGCGIPTELVRIFKILWHVDPLLGNDHEKSSYTTFIAV